MYIGRVLESPETAMVWNESDGAPEPLPLSRRSEAIFQEEIFLELSDRYDVWSDFIPVQGTLDQILWTIHSFYQHMDAKYKKHYGDHGGLRFSYDADHLEEHGWYMGDGLSFEGIMRNGEHWTLCVGSL